MFSKLMIGSLIALGFAAQAHADTYEVDIARVQLDIACTVTGGDGGSTDCSINIKSQGKVAVSMAQDDKAGQKGYTGIDAVVEGASQYMLGISADASKALKASCSSRCSRVRTVNHSRAAYKLSTATI